MLEKLHSYRSVLQNKITHGNLTIQFAFMYLLLILLTLLHICFYFVYSLWQYYKHIITRYFLYFNLLLCRIHKSLSLNCK